MEWYVVGMKYTEDDAFRVANEDVESVKDGFDYIGAHYRDADQWFIINDKTAEEILVRVNC